MEEIQCTGQGIGVGEAYYISESLLSFSLQVGHLLGP